MNTIYQLNIPELKIILKLSSLKEWPFIIICEPTRQLGGSAGLVQAWMVFVQLIHASYGQQGARPVALLIVVGLAYLSYTFSR